MLGSILLGKKIEEYFSDEKSNNPTLLSMCKEVMYDALLRIILLEINVTTLRRGTLPTIILLSRVLRSRAVSFFP